MSGPSLRVLRAAALVVLVTAVGCGGSENGAGDASRRGADSGASVLRIGVSQANLDEPRCVQMNADVKAAAEKHAGLEIVFKNAENHTRKQREHVEAFVAQKVDLIIISPKEAQPLTGPVAQAVDAGIPVIVLDRAVIGDKYTCFIRADNEEIGAAAARWLIKKLGRKGNLVELKGPETSAPSRDRHRGFHAALKDYPDMRVLYQGAVEGKESLARTEMKTALGLYTDIDAVYAHHDAAAHGAYLAAQAAGREKDILFVGGDALPREGITYVKEGYLDATFLYPTGGAEAIDVALKILHNEPFEKNIQLESRLFTRENVERGGGPTK